MEEQYRKAFVLTASLFALLVTVFIVVTAWLKFVLGFSIGDQPTEAVVFRLQPFWLCEGEVLNGKQTICWKKELRCLENYKLVAADGNFGCVPLAK